MRIDDSLPFGFEDTSFQAAGGFLGVKRLANTFYDILDGDSRADSVRNMHGSSLSESRDKLTRFLCGWLGGPKKYHEKYGSIDIPQAHAQLNIDEQARDAWLYCMDKAIDQQPYSEKFAEYLKAQFRIPADRILVASQDPK